MADVWVDDDRLRITLSVPERVLSLQAGDVEVTLESIEHVRVVRDVLSHVRGRRKPGANFPGMLAIGVWRGVEGGQTFNDFVLIQEPGSGVIVTTTGEFDRILLSTDEPERFAFELTDRNAIRASCGQPPSG
jgi:hypothetical protein